MRNLIFIFSFFLLGFLLTKCKTHESSSVPFSDRYPKDTLISKKDGTLIDSLTFYYPTTFIDDTSLNQHSLDNFYKNWFSSALYAFKEPVLYNYYLGHDIYRFLWLRSFDRPILLVLNQDNTNVWLMIKILDRQPRFLDQTILKALPRKGKGLKVELVPDSVVKGDRKADIVLNRRINLTSREWNKVDSLIKAADFWAVPPTKQATGMDGSQWIIEAHTKENYRFVQRWAPKDKFRIIGEFLIELSGLKEEIY